ncbi:MAG: OmpA family protein [Anaeromyxobacteraceae bacterium]
MTRLHVAALSLLTLLVAGPAFAGEPDRPGSKDHPVLTRMQNMHIVNYRTNPFERFAFRTGAARGAETAVEGQFFEIRYKADAGANVPTPLAILRNHQDAVRAIGGKVVYEDKRYTTLEVAKDSKEIWVLVDTAWGQGYQLTIVEKAAMAQEVKASAEVFKAGLAATGHVEVPGIYFDTGKATLKPESAAAVAEIAKLLAGDPALQVFVVGHTDNVAAVELNLKLSQDRAAAVVQELVSKHGVAAARLRPYGVGPFAPVASNDAEEGRAKNRRVELVKR